MRREVEKEREKLKERERERERERLPFEHMAECDAERTDER